MRVGIFLSFAVTSVIALSILPPSFDEVSPGDFIAQSEKYYNELFENMIPDEEKEDAHLFGLMHFLNNFTALSCDEKNSLLSHVKSIKTAYKSSTLPRPTHLYYLKSLIQEAHCRVASILIQSALDILNKEFLETADYERFDGVLAEYKLIDEFHRKGPVFVQIADLSIIEVAKKATKDKDAAPAVKKTCSRIAEKALKCMRHYILRSQYARYLPSFASVIEDYPPVNLDFSIAMNDNHLLQLSASIYNSNEKVDYIFKYSSYLADRNILETNEGGLCRFIPASSLLELDNPTLEAFSAECLAVMPGFSGPDAIDLGPVVPRLTEDAFSLAYRFLHTDTVAAITTEQMKWFGHRDYQHLSTRICWAGIRLSQFSSAKRIHYLDENCIRNALRSDFTDILAAKVPDVELIMNDTTCEYIDAVEVLSQFKDDQRHLMKEIPASCLRSMYKFLGNDSEDMSPFVPFLSNDTFANIDNGAPHPNTLKTLSVEQAKLFSIENPIQCKDIDLSIISEEVFSHLPGKCIMAASQNYSTVADMLSIDKILNEFKRPNYEADIFNFLSPDLVLSKFSEEHIRQGLENDNSVFLVLLRAQAEFDLSNDLRQSLCSTLSIIEVSSWKIPGKERNALSLLPISCVQVMKGFYARKDANSIDLSPYLRHLRTGIFNNLLPGLDDGTIIGMPVRLGPHFGSLDFSACRHYDLSLLQTDVLLKINHECVKSSATSFPDLPMRISTKALNYFFDVLNPYLSFELVYTEYKDQIFDVLLPQNAVQLKGFWDRTNLALIKDVLTADIIKHANIAPTKELIEFLGDSLASHWAAFNPSVCKKIIVLKVSDRYFVKKLPVLCQAHYYNTGFMKILDLASVSNELFDALLLVDYFKGMSKDEISFLPNRLKLRITPEVFETLEEGPLYPHKVEHFPFNVFALATEPLNLEVSKSLDIKYFEERLCLLHYKDELPPYVKMSFFCRREMQLLQKYFPERQSWKYFLRVTKFMMKPIQEINFAGALPEFSELNRILDKKVPFNLAELKEYLEFLHSRFAIFTHSPEQSKIKLQILGQNGLFMLAQAFVKTEEDLLTLARSAYSQNDGINMKLQSYEVSLYPKFLYNLVIGVAKHYSAAGNIDFINSDALHSGSLNISFLSKCVSMILNGPSWKLYWEGRSNEMSEFREENQITTSGRGRDKLVMVPFSLSPMLEKVNLNSNELFFPFRSSRHNGSFVAYTLLLALQEDARVPINLDIEFYRLAAFAPPNGQMTPEFILMADQYHNRMYDGRGETDSLQKVLMRFKSFLDDPSDNFLNFAFPQPGAFVSPLSAVITHHPIPLRKEIPAGYQTISSRQELEDYIVEYERLTLEEFRYLALNFLTVFGQRIYAFASLATPGLWVNYTTISPLNSRDVFDALNILPVSIDSLVRDKITGERFSINIMTAINMFLQRMNPKRLEKFFKMFVEPSYVRPGSQTLGLIYFEGHDIEPLTANDPNVVTFLDELAPIRSDIFREQCEFFRLEESDAEFDLEDTFYPIIQDSLYSTIKIPGPLNNYSFYNSLFYEMMRI